MKRLQDLSLSDLERAAVWRYEGESDDVARVRATARNELSASDSGLFIARTQFILASGAHHVGFCTPDAGGLLEDVQPVIVTADGPVYFCFDAPPSQETLDAQWTRLGVGHEQIFPVHFRCTVLLDGEYVTGTIEADDLTGAA
ncbi:MAG TPA: hypothetical protein VGQ36_02065 [Thermoanaerobaculia bacterium]|jgi:hypothetical protein|nr:hypothetical protein [Thermoanaerobaculia bacterium]